VGGPVTAGAINNQIGTIVNGDTSLAVYPGAGIEFNIKRIGFRAEAGDEVIFLRGSTTNNVRVAIRPPIRFYIARPKLFHLRQLSGAAFLHRKLVTVSSLPCY